jgi:hypothetical protein
LGSRKGANKDFDSAVPTNGRTWSPANSEWFGLCIGPLSRLIGKSSERPGAGKGARFVRGGGKSFPGLKRFCGANACRRGPFCLLETLELGLKKITTYEIDAAFFNEFGA